MVDRSPLSAEDALVLGRHSAAEIETARDRVRAYLDERKNWPSLADSVDGFGATGVRLLASDLRVLLSDLARARVNVGDLQYMLRAERNHRANTRAERDLLKAENHERRHDWYVLSHIVGCLDEQPADEVFEDARKLVTERDQTKARIATIAATLSRAAGMMATDSRDWSRDRSDAWLYGLIVAWECEDEHEHDAVMCGGDSALREVAAQHGWSADDVTRIRRFRAALQRARREALREMTREDEADGLLDVGTGFVDTRGPEDAAQLHAGADGLAYLAEHRQANSRTVPDELIERAVEVAHQGGDWDNTVEWIDPPAGSAPDEIGTVRVHVDRAVRGAIRALADAGLLAHHDGDDCA